MALTTSEVIKRARTMLSRRTIYKLGKGGMNPSALRASDSNNELDCSGFVAWCLGISRHTSNSFYASYNGDGNKGWFETTAVYRDANHHLGLVTRIDNPVRGCIVVYGDSIVNGQRRQGHIGIVTEVSEAGVARKVIHCSSSGYRDFGDAIQENNFAPLLNNSRAIYARYDNLAEFRGLESANVSLFDGLVVSGNGFLESVSKDEENSLDVPAFEYFKNGKIIYQAWSSKNESAFYFQSHAKICADGAPDAYKIGNKGTDDLRNAGKPPSPNASTTKNLDRWSWWALVVDEHNNPVIQTQSDSNPGYFVSTTAHVNPQFKKTDPRAYVNANEIPYIVLPKKNAGSAKLGDFAYVVDRKTGITCPAIYSEVGPKDALGEISIKAAEILHIPSNPRKGGVSRKDIFYIVFPGSGNGKPRSFEEIKDEAERLFKEWGGLERLEKMTAYDISKIPQEAIT
ncbi:chitosanase of glycosyl hydrolase group 75 [Cnuella takakiae]|uniref:Chitosanase of glycosyl hydrolase group 75 n=1 Tax=Cnuella takakiae TaxID=1302690 RepID=A0A1M5CHB4_9BACT|nr:glycoside hydrolase family 75 protein [Cnuella takakiae]OLY91822.1 hypothetical protein BUE76_07855 [Cnuella takakiae]SHF54061.1 chitosanase of glycosyl hydrolase group 75 [Cnuella takakiae]